MGPEEDTSVGSEWVESEEGGGAVAPESVEGGLSPISGCVDPPRVS